MAPQTFRELVDAAEAAHVAPALIERFRRAWNNQGREDWCELSHQLYAALGPTNTSMPAPRPKRPARPLTLF